MMTELNATDRARLRAQIIDEELSEAIAAYVRGGSRAELRHAVAAYVSTAKRTLTPPQDVIALLKAHVQRDAQPHVSPGDYPSLMQLVVGWGIEEYYRET
jgi:hypothetical protein